MNVLSVSHYYPPHVGGLEIIARNQADALAEHGHEVTVVTFAGKSETAGTKSENGVTVHRVYALNFFDTRFGIPFPIGGISLAARLWREVACADIVHLHDVFYQSSWVAYLFARLFGKPLILTQHVGLVEHPSKIVTAIERIVYHTWGRFMFGYAKTIIAYNPIVSEFLRRSGVDPEKILELSNGIDLSLFRPAEKGEKTETRKAFGLPLDKPLVLFVGRFVPKKGFETVFQARDTAYDIVFAGSGAIPKDWHAERGVHFMGALNQSDLARLYRAADIFALPARGELMTLAMQEAMASGLPIITTDEPAYALYAIDRNLIAFIEPTVKALKYAIKRIVASKERAGRMASYSRAIAKERFDWKKNIKSVIRLYAEIEQECKPVVTTSWDDGHVLDLKLASLMKRYGIAGTFYIAPENSEIPPAKRLNQKSVAALAKDFEIGAHTMTHPRLTEVDDARAEHEIRKSKEVLERWVNAPIKSFCYPAGKYSRKHERMVGESGFALARTTKRFSFGEDSDRYALPTTVHTYDHWSDAWHIARFARFNPLRFFRFYCHWDNLAIALFDRALKKGGIFHLWGHSWEIEARNEWDRLERVFRHIANRDGIRYVANKDLA